MASHTESVGSEAHPPEWIPSEFFEGLAWNPFDPDVHADPYPLYHRLRTDDPVHWNPPGIWVLTRYADIAAALRDPRLSSDFRNSDLYRVFQQEADQAELFEEVAPSMLFIDPPDHTRMRSLVSSAFSARMVERMRPRVQTVVDQLLDPVSDQGSMDVIADLAYPLPVTVICELLGVPQADHHRFHEWSADLVHLLDPFIPPDVFERALAARRSFREYFDGLFAERRARPRDDFLSALIQAEEQGDRLTEAELFSTCILLLVAGHETTVNLIGNGTLALLRHPDQFERLRRNPAMIRQAVEELLRFDSPVQHTGRTALETMELGGKSLERGQQIVLLIGAANRDSAQFADPDRLDLGRDDTRHLSFGGGPHFCLGAPLARLEGQLALGELVRRFPDMHRESEAPEWRSTITLRGLRTLPVLFSSAR